MVARRAPRGKCRHCGRVLALTLTGRVRRHLLAPGVAGVVCRGSGQLPERRHA